jgi:hypothetical protein
MKLYDDNLFMSALFSLMAEKKAENRENNADIKRLS